MNKTNKFENCYTIEDCFEKMKDHCYNTGETIFSLAKKDNYIFKNKIIEKGSNAEWNKILGSAKDSEDYKLFQTSLEDTLKLYNLGIIAENWQYYRNGMSDSMFFIFNFTTRHVFNIHYYEKDDNTVETVIEDEVEF